MKNKYSNRSRIREAKFREILKYFSMDFSASQTADLIEISRRSISDVYQKLRQRIYNLTKQEWRLTGEIGVDESYFGARRVRGAKRKVPVIGLLKREGKVYTKIVKSCSKAELMPIIKGRILEESMVHRWLEEL